MDITIKDLMIPIGEYVSVGIEDTLLDCFLALEEDKKTRGQAHSHRDVLVFGPDGGVRGKVTMTDIYLALEPGYKSILESMDQRSVLTPDYMAAMFREYDLWSAPLADLCRKASGLKVADIMHEPAETEFVDAGAGLDKALHLYVMGAHQPLLVREGGKVVGALRFGDVFSRIKALVLACAR
ncbi:CBS domain-containing protein [Desulfocurvus sp. DL9XJH121]